MYSCDFVYTQFGELVREMVLTLDPCRKRQEDLEVRRRQEDPYSVHVSFKRTRVLLITVEEPRWYK